MIEPRLAAHVQIAALRRAAEASGAFATIARKGEPTAGTILLIRREQGINPALFERFTSLSGKREWREITSQHTDKEQHLEDYLDRRVSADPDVWILELDVPFAERFTDIIGIVD